MDDATGQTAVPRQPGQALAATLASAATCLQRIAATPFALEPRTEPEMEQLRQLEAGVARLFRQVRAADLLNDPALQRRLARLRSTLNGCGWRLRSQVHLVEESLAWLRGSPVDSGLYHPGQPRQASAGAWMNVRSSP
jgi:hypothetical protein